MTEKELAVWGIDFLKNKSQWLKKTKKYQNEVEQAREDVIIQNLDAFIKLLQDKLK